MKNIFIDLLHTYQYLDKNSINFNTNLEYINDSDHNKLLGISNIPNNKSLYKIFIEKVNNYHDKNIKIMVRINFKILSEYICNGVNIPNRDKLFKLIRRNFYDYSYLNNYITDNKYIFKLKIENNNPSIFKKKYAENILNWLYKTENKNNEITLLNNNIVKLHNIYIDTKIERFYLNENNITHKIQFNGGIVFGNPVLFNKNIFINLHQKYKKVKKNTLINNNATLILCDTNNFEEWKEIVSKNSYLLIHNKNSLDKFTYNDLVSNNFNNINYNILIHQTYLSYWNDYISYNKNFSESLKTIIFEKYRDPNILNKNKTIFQIINWKRIIIDNYNFDETKNQSIYQQILLFNTNNKWIYHNHNTINYDILSKNIKLFTNEKITKLDKNIINTFSSNIKFIDSDTKFYQLENIKLEFTNFEIKYYKYLSENKLNVKQYCSLSENEYNINYKFIDSDYKILDDKCSICMDKLNSNNLGILPCGHHFCFTCIYNWNISENYSMCPMCRKNISSITKLVNKDNYLNDIFNKNQNYGTKLSYLIKKVYNNNKTILFISQFDNTINNITKILDNLEVKYSNLNLKKRSQNNNIFLINLKNIPLSNIPNIEEVIFVEPLYNKSKYYLDVLYSKINYKFSLKKFKFLVINDTIEIS